MSKADKQKQQRECLHHFRTIKGKRTCTLCGKELKLASGLNLDKLDRLKEDTMTPKEMKDMREAEKSAAQEQQLIDEERINNLASTDRMDPRLAAERCSCGHKRVIHLDAAWGLAKGHGACAACKCAKFTWVASE